MLQTLLFQYGRKKDRVMVSDEDLIQYLYDFNIESKYVKKNSG
jgi:hypothetical protein